MRTRGRDPVCSIYSIFEFYYCSLGSDRLRLVVWALLRPGALVAPDEFAIMIRGIFPILLCGMLSL